MFSLPIRYLVIHLVLLTCNLAHRYSKIASSSSFVPWPHRKVFDGQIGEGEWMAHKTFRQWTSMMHITRRLDIVQHHALSDGVYVPNNLTKYYIFSAEEARDCLAGKTVYVVGDSYMKNMFIGLGDILLNRPFNYEMRSATPRAAVYEQISTDLEILSRGKFTARYIWDECRQYDLTCYQTFLPELFTDTESKTLETPDAIIMNVLVHHLRLHPNETDIVDTYIGNLTSMFQKYGRSLTWATGPAYDISKIPRDYVEAAKARPTDMLNYQTMQICKELGIPLLDYFSITGYCKWDNCTSDGGHRSRFVNRFKAQMWLNNICSLPPYVSDPTIVNQVYG